MRGVQGTVFTSCTVSYLSIPYYEVLKADLPPVDGCVRFLCRIHHKDEESSLFLGETYPFRYATHVG